MSNIKYVKASEVRKGDFLCLDTNTFIEIEAINEFTCGDGETGYDCRLIDGGGAWLRHSDKSVAIQG